MWRCVTAEPEGVSQDTTSNVEIARDRHSNDNSNTILIKHPSNTTSRCPMKTLLIVGLHVSVLIGPSSGPKELRSKMYTYKIEK